MHQALNAYRRAALKSSLNPAIQVVELDAHINDEGLAVAAADLLMESRGVPITRTGGSPKRPDVLIGLCKRFVTMHRQGLAKAHPGSCETLR